MGEDSRLTALTTACDDLQAQLEAGDRTARHVHHDLAEIGAIFASLTQQTVRLTVIMQHMQELRTNMHEQRKALREVRAAAKLLCSSVATAQEEMIKLGEGRGHDERRNTADLLPFSPRSGAADAQDSETDD